MTVEASTIGVPFAGRHAAELVGELERQAVQLVVVLGLRGCRDRLAKRARCTSAAVRDPEPIADAIIERLRPPAECDRRSLDHEQATCMLACKREELLELVAAPWGGQ